MLFLQKNFINQIHTNSENIDNEDDASILLSMCTFAPHLDISLMCKIDAELEEECAVIAWKEDDHDEDDEEDEEEIYYDDASGSWRTASNDQEDSDGNGSVSNSDHDVAASGSHDSEGEDESNSSLSSHDNDASASSGSVDHESWDEDHPQYCFEVDRDNLLESSLNALQDMSKCVPITLRGF